MPAPPPLAAAPALAVAPVPAAALAPAQPLKAIETRSSSPIAEEEELVLENY